LIRLTPVGLPKGIEWRGDPIKQFNRDSRTFSSELVFMTLKCEVADKDEPINLPVLVLNAKRPQQIEVIASVKEEPSRVRLKAVAFEISAMSGKFW
jgi:hypothetical protein